LHIDHDTTISYYTNINQLGSAGISEEALADRLERCVYPNAEFFHADHIRLAWHYMRVYGEERATERMRRTISGFAVSLGHPEKYHDTVTVAWMRAVAAAMACTPGAADFAAFLAAHPWLLDRDCLLAFYSRGRLFSDEARARWVEPDLHRLP
jgi:hypothetical protein